LEAKIMDKLLLGLLVMLSASLPIAAAESAAKGPIMVFGDSLSAGWGIDRERGWVALLEQRLEEEGIARELVNASVSGETSAGGRARLPQALQRHRPGVVILELGGNDGLQGLPLKNLKANLNKMLDEIEAAGAQPLLVGMQIPPNLGPIYTRAFAAIFPEIAEARAIPLVPFMLEGVAGNAEMMQNDDIHPNEAGQGPILENIWPVLEPLLEGESG
jgi:acyl-CoA thioesterase-1